jgi:hypothetical protein
MRRLLVLALGGLVLLTAGWVVAPSALACSCVPATAAEQLERADVVFVGTLVSREVVHPAPGVVSSDDPAVHVFAVDAVLTGTVGPSQEVVSADSSASCGLDLQGDGPFLVYAAYLPGGPAGQLTATLCGGTAPVDAELVADGQAPADGEVTPVPLDPDMSAYEDPPASTGLLLGGLFALTVLVGGLAALAGRRADRRALRVVVLTRD